MRLKPGMSVEIKSTGQRVIVIDKAPAKSWLDPVPELPLDPSPETARMFARRKHAEPEYKTANSGNLGQRWWVQDATTGRPLTYAIREREVGIV